jgi:hypothetical protein
MDAGPQLTRVLLSNGGDGPVFATDIMIHSKLGFFNRRVNRLISANTVEIVESKTPIESMKLPYIVNNTGWASLAMIESITSLTQGCVLPLVFDANNSGLKAVQEHYRTHSTQQLAVHSVKGTLRYFSVHSGTSLESPFPVTIAFVRSNAPECKDISLE